jgi:hypothetical protein
MSQEKQDQIFGRLTREHGLCQKRIGALEAKMSETSEFLLQRVIL